MPDIDIVARNKLSDLTATGWSSAATPAISLTAANYNSNGQINLDDNGSIKIGTVPDTNLAPFAVAANRTATQNLHCIEDFSVITETAPTLGYAGFNSQATITGSVAADHANGFQSTLSVKNLTSITNLNGFVSQNNVNNSAVTYYAGFNVYDVTVQNGGTIQYTQGLVISPLSSGSVHNWAVYQSAASNLNYFNGPIGLGVALPPQGYLYLNSAYDIAWDNGSGSVASTITQPTPGSLRILNNNLSLEGTLVFAGGHGYGTNSSTNASTLLTATNIFAGSIETTLNMTGAITVASNIQLPTIANLLARIDALTAGIATIGQTWKLRIINGGGTGSGVWTVVQSSDTGYTLSGAMTIPASLGYRDFYVTINSGIAATLQSLGTGTIGTI